MNKVELLAPAGDYACFRAAINAGADAIYLGGSKFGARAYANNFTQEEISKALREAHVLGRKIYLTVNTLVKEKEIDELVPYMEPLYEAGLDGVIVQDMGVLECLRENFKGLELHASTQMTITGVYGARFMKKMGVCRVVPARELSLDEIRDIKSDTGLDMECFIHGAMCYAYSGQCLFSSILGGRSGNRGRCAGPCRLPYKDESGRLQYPLSLKDMYTLPIVPELIEAGIDSFKIEGRMKSPEYVAGVTSIYRKYIDSYLTNSDKPYKVAKSDENILSSLYIRSDICGGYYKQHNDKSMVTLKEPGYKGTSEDVVARIKQDIIDNDATLPIVGKAYIEAGKRARLELYYGNHRVSYEGDEVSVAKNRPLTEEDIKSKLGKLGDTAFRFEKLEVVTDGNSFMPVKTINELRRGACELLENALIADNRTGSFEKTATPNIYANKKSELFKSVSSESELYKSALVASVSSLEQLETALGYDHNVISGIYISSDLYLTSKDKVCRLVDKYKGEKYFCLSLPHIFRKRSYKYLDKYKEALDSFDGVVVRNQEELEWLMEIGYKGEYVADYMIYAWNNKASDAYDDFVTRQTVPVELNKKEMAKLCNESKKELVIYGRLPLMYSANCARKTLDKCINDHSGKQNVYELTDRYNNTFPVVQNCLHCYNILYNTVPLSLHGQMEYLMNMGYGAYRLDFTIEDAREVKEILDYYTSLWAGNKPDNFPLKEYTNGHYKRGVE